MSNLTADIIAALESYADKNRVELAKRSYPTKMRVLGVIVPNVKKILKEVKTQTKSWESGEKIRLCNSLIDTNIFECQQLAYELIGNDKNVLNALTLDDIEALGRNLDNWISVDYYSTFIVGYAWRTGKIDIKKIKHYLKSEDFWQRRIAIVSTIALNQKARGGIGDAKLTLEICQIVVDDHQDLILKALSWALRELAKVDREPVVSFMEKNKEKLHKKVLREVTNKIQFGTKN